jgi:catechol 2,3-dioxygenase-like lactoylglutathione lyase family enzyme
MKVHHLSVVSKDLAKYRAFAKGLLQLKQHPKHSGWFVAKDRSIQLHVIEIEDTASDMDDMHHYYRHSAIEVSDLAAVLKRARKLRLKPFQMDENGEEKRIKPGSTKLDFGLRTLFVRDPDDNLWEFVQPGRSWPALFS